MKWQSSDLCLYLPIAFLIHLFPLSIFCGQLSDSWDHNPFGGETLVFHLSEPSRSWHRMQRKASQRPTGLESQGAFLSTYRLSSVNSRCYWWLEGGQDRAFRGETIWIFHCMRWWNKPSFPGPGHDLQGFWPGSAPFKFYLQDKTLWFVIGVEPEERRAMVQWSGVQWRS